MKATNLDNLNLRLSTGVLSAYDELVALRRTCHQRPELGFKETGTQKVVMQALEQAGIGATPIGGTGVTGLIQGKTPGKVLLLRGDMDALPIEEENDLPYKSRNPGVMHACGHDAHVAMLITVARLVAARGLEKGTIKLMFQPGEEGQGGAKALIEAGILEDPKVDGALALHVWAPSPTGQVVTLSGPAAASVDGFKITIKGKGTHAAMPESGVNPITIAAQIVSAQTSLTSNLPATDPAILSFTAIRGGSAFNVIPDTAEILGTFRTFSKSLRAHIRNDLIDLASTRAEALGGTAIYESLAESMPTVNDPQMTLIAKEAAAAVVGPERVIEGAPLMVSEDFGEVLDQVPGSLVLLGCGAPGGGTVFPHHHPRFNIDERVLPIGVQLALEFIDRFEF
jgi:amidohydrolase